MLHINDRGNSSLCPCDQCNEPSPSAEMEEIANKIEELKEELSFQEAELIAVGVSEEGSVRIMELITPIEEEIYSLEQDFEKESGGLCFDDYTG